VTFADNAGALHGLDFRDMDVDLLNLLDGGSLAAYDRQVG
jgi:hypothetical protein